jgi:MFS family permease
MGKLSDRYGPRFVMVGGTFLMGLGLLATSRVAADWQFYLTYGAVAGFGMGALYVPGTSTVSRFFLHNRGMALGLTVAGSGLGPFVMLPVTQHLIRVWDWRTSFLVLGIMLVMGALLPLIVLRGRGRPEDVGIVHGGNGSGVGAKNPATAGPASAEPHSLGLGEAARTSAFWMWVIVYGLTALAIDGVILVHLPAYLTDIAFDEGTAAFATGLLPLTFALGAIALGAMGDRVGRRTLLGGSLALGIPLIFWLMALSATDMASLFASVLLLGLLSGAIYPTIVAVAADSFGQKAMGAIVGSGTVAVGVGGMVGPALAGYLRDVTSSYSLAFWIVIFALALASVLTILIRPRRQRLPVAVVDSCG